MRLAVLVTGAALFVALASSTHGVGDEPGSAPFSKPNGTAGRIPPNWRVAPKQLVPQMLDPREVVSLGTGPLRVGGGGNCGRYPAAALRAMTAGDTLITVQVRRNADLGSWPPNTSMPKPLPMPSTDAVPGAVGRVYVQELYLDRGEIWAYVAYGSRPSAAELETAEQILTSISLGR